MPTGDRNRHKVCHCTANCNHLLSFSQRKHHYQLVDDPSAICRSTTPSDSEEFTGNNESSEISDNESVDHMDVDQLEHIASLDFGSADIMHNINHDTEAFSDVPDNGQESGDGFFDGGDEERFKFDSDSELNESFQSLDEMREAIEDEMGPGMDLEMWKLREPALPQSFNLI